MTSRKGNTKERGPRDAAPASRPRDARGRFIKASPPPVQAVRTMDRTGQVHTRDARGRFVKMDRTAPRAIGRKDTGRQRILQSSEGAAKASRSPKGFTEALALDLHFNSAPRVVMDNATRDRDTVIKWRGRFYRVRPESAGAAQDAFREITDNYVKLFLPFMDSPQLRIPMAELPGVDVLDFDKLDTMNEEVTDTMIGDTDAETAQERFLESAADILDTLTNTNEATDETREAVRAPVGRKRTRSAASKGRRKRKG